MKIAITATGNSLESTLDERFGRCSYFVIYDTRSNETEFIANPNREAVNGAGPSAVQLIASRGVGKIVAMHFGSKIIDLLESLHIQMIKPDSGITSVGEVIEMLGRQH
ncbi:MAG TPA: NifB/NifX family molybdenum-iron cluster-binding protein [Bacteroidales bacterium]|nr:NifB/NifX family molybdenum-iron cluster-binding protein [Bacteroidales bacterium]HSA43008.1 NifB/NifX family molybdenum-iron cluster-binding protein [Bacteroidales bacterium]